MPRLYELTDNYAALLAQLDDAETEAQRDEIMQAIRQVAKMETINSIKKHELLEAIRFLIERVE